MTGNEVHGNLTINQSGARPHRSLEQLVQLFGDADLPLVGALNPYLLGVTSSAFGGPADHGHRDEYLTRTANDVDARLRRAMSGSRMVIVVGPSKVGKTRTLFEAVHAFDPAARVAWPVHDGIAELAAHPRLASSTDTVVVWLDDLHEYLTGSNSITPAVLARLTARPGRTLVVATLRSEMRAQLRGDGELRRETRMLLEQAILIDLASTSDDPGETAAASRAYRGQEFNGHGLAEVLAGAPELLARYDDARAADPIGYTVIAVSVDWARIGRKDPIPEGALTDLTIETLRHSRPELDPTESGVRAAITAARTPPRGGGRAAALHTLHLDAGVRGYRPFDYLVAADDGQADRTPRPVPEAFWHRATRDADPEILTDVGFTAHGRGNIAAASTIWHRAAEVGHPMAMFDLGVLYGEERDEAAAEVWFRRAAEAGHLAAMSNLGMLLRRRGEANEAEEWYRRAAAAGFVDAEVNLGVLFEERGDLVEAETWWRSAAEAGNLGAMVNLGLLLRRRGEPAEAEQWYRRAADGGVLSAMMDLGVLLEDRGDRAAAEVWCRRAAEAGYPGAMYNLGMLLRRRGEAGAAERWYRRAAEAGVLDAMVNLGALLDSRGEPVAAEGWYRRAAEAGQTTAMMNLGALLDSRGAPGAEAWYRKAAAAEHVGAMVNLGAMLELRGEWEEAAVWYRKAADAGQPDAMANLGGLLFKRKDRAGAETWCRRAANLGQVPAMYNLGFLLAERGDRAKAEAWWRRAADGGHSGAMMNLGATHYERGDVAQAVQWWTMAARAGQPRAIEILQMLRARQEDRPGRGF
ncbi:tetratricopeptide repeat protein [Nocardia harenae]|uniref:tetratricopeptide repeat protein n=1 Tax=Nocardia harenae TaxID=358707 RepID=UPI00082B5A68|nr:tetratricopeptide repeat protein [Nocardia harenae]